MLAWLLQVDAFASRPFRGNSAAVILLPERDGPDDETLQDIAMENNLSETSFLEPIPAGEDAAAATNFHLRWFTPTREVKLCGHATLAASAAIWDCASAPLSCSGLENVPCRWGGLHGGWRGCLGGMGASCACTRL